MKRLHINKVELKKTVYDVKDLPADRLPEVALVGRSNVGKSSFINCLTGKKGLARTSSVPGKTRSVNYYLINNSWYLVDLPGYGYAKAAMSERVRWSALVDHYLTSREHLVGLVHLVDIRHPLLELDLAMSEWAKQMNLPCLIVGTKVDKLSWSERQVNLKKLKEGLGFEVIPFSSVTGEGREEVKMVLAGWLAKTG